jgi:3',5'-cyclic AMP phosphodiesterase CpdA
MREIVRLENPDLVVVTGDIVSDYAWDRTTRPWMAEKYDKFARVMEEEGVWWATAMGNHDFGTDLSMHEVLHLDMSYSRSLTQQNIHNLTMDFTYMLPVHDESGVATELRLWFINTGRDSCLGKGGWDCPTADQIKWFRDLNSEIPSDDPSKGRGFAFMHIPLPEYVDLYNNGRYFGAKNENIACGSINTGFFAAMLEQPSVNWVTCGHDHSNDFYGDHLGINLAYGRKTGYGGYGPSGMKHGARVFEVSLNPTYNIDTWVREEGGGVSR